MTHILEQVNNYKEMKELTEGDLSTVLKYSYKSKKINQKKQTFLRIEEIVMMKGQE